MYTIPQCRSIARELVRAGGVLERAAEKSRARLEAAGGQLSRKIVLAGIRRIRDHAFDAEDDHELKFKQLTLLLGFVRESGAL
jgi:hypothetical protein